MPVGYLRGFTIILVVMHHALLAYTTHGVFSLIVDGSKFQYIDYIVEFNDIYFMSLLFFISGLFVWKSLKEKKAARFLGRRFIRLGIPLAVGFLVLNIPAYYFGYIAYI